MMYFEDLDRQELSLDERGDLVKSEFSIPDSGMFQDLFALKSSGDTVNSFSFQVLLRKNPNYAT